MRTDRRGLELIERFEGFPHDGHPYRDPVGVWTRGYGRTEGIGPDSPRISRVAAERELIDLLHRRYEPAVNALGLPLTQAMFDALVSFVYNVGTGALEPDTGIGHLLRQRDWHGAADELLRWDHAGGRVLEGLTRRRRAERALFLHDLPRRPMHTRAPRLFPVRRTARRIKREHPELLPAIRQSCAHLIAHWPRLVITSTTGGRHSPGSLHPHGMAADLAVVFTGDAKHDHDAQVYMDRAAAWMANRSRLRHQLYEGIHRPVAVRVDRLSVKNGAVVLPAFWGTETWQGHGDHIHLSRRT